MTPQDTKDIREMLPFVLTSDEIQQYKVKYSGLQKLDQDLSCFVFEVEPRKIEKGKRYFQGKVWVEDRDYFIVMTRGKFVPDSRENGSENKSPAFETKRGVVDGFWFPVVADADETLKFPDNSVRIRVSVKFSNYRGPSTR